MDKSRSSRRRLIRVGAIGLATSIAGCSGYLNERDDYSRDPPDERNNDTETDDPTNELPDDPPATFQSTYGDFTYHDLFVQYEGLPDPSDMANAGAHYDSSLMPIEILDENTARATIKNVNVTRDIDLTLHIRDANRRWQEVTKTLTATDTDTHETRRIEFDLSDITLPTGAGSICCLLANDTHPGDDLDVHFKNHQFVGIPYKNGVNWVNNENFNYTRWMGDDYAQKTAPRGVRGNKRAEPPGHVEFIDTDDERIVFLATRNTINGEVFGVSCHIDHKPAQDYKNGSNTYKYRYGPKYEAHFATEISHFRELADKLDQAITGIGITQSRQRLEVLGDLIQTIPYIPQNLDPSPTVVLYDILGDCSSKSVLMSCILQNDPWDILPGYIDCEINGVGHWTIGLDVNDLSGDPGFTVATTAEQVNDGYPDTEYAFFDMTYDSTIGERTSGVEDEIVYDLGDFTHNPGRRANDPPNY